MNKNQFYTIAAISLLSHLSLGAWSRGNHSQEAAATLPQNFPFSQSQEWFTEESYLLLKPYMENMSYGNKGTLKNPEESVFTNNIKVQEPEFEWSSGVRVAIGRYLPNHDLWDIGCTTTFYYTDTQDKTKANVAADSGFNPSFIPSSPTPRDSGQFNWKLNYWTVDLMVGRLFDMTKEIVFHPYFGLRSSFQYQHAQSQFSQFQGFGVNDSKSTSAKSSIDNDFWGVGPRVGTAFIYYFENHFSLLANISTSLLVGGQHLKLNAKEKRVAVDGSDVQEVLRTTKSSDSLGVIRSNVEASIGLGWERWMRNNTVRIAPSVNFEGALWFAMNQIYNFYRLDSVSTNIEQRRQGNLGLMGVSFNLQVDF